MSKILMPIKPKYVEQILSGKKKYEYRKTMPKREDIDKMIIYSTSPVMKIVAEVEVKGILSDTPDVIFDETHNASGISRESYNQYFKNRTHAIAYKLGEVKVYDKPKSLTDLGINYVPQSFVYLD